MTDTTIRTARPGYDDLQNEVYNLRNLLAAAALFQPDGALRTLIRLQDLFDVFDQRLAHLEKRLDDAGIKRLPDGIPDDDITSYLLLPDVDWQLRGETPQEALGRLAAMGGDGEVDGGALTYTVNGPLPDTATGGQQ
jgi:hypothetical protein